MDPGRSRPPRLAIDVVLPAGVRAPGLVAWLHSVAPATARGALSIAVVSDARVRALNRTYRKKNTNTDVLSFPAGGPPDGGPHEPRWGPASGVEARWGPASAGPEKQAWGPASAGPFLGEIVIAAGVARRQAREAGHSLQTELRILALHGLLHLLGYDHEQDTGEMGRLERRLRRKGGLREGLIERAADPSEPAAPPAPGRRRR
jgi:probable rRNA maturation factor